MYCYVGPIIAVDMPPEEMDYEEFIDLLCSTGLSYRFNEEVAQYDVYDSDLSKDVDYETSYAIGETDLNQPLPDAFTGLAAKLDERNLSACRLFGVIIHQ